MSVGFPSHELPYEVRKSLRHLRHIKEVVDVIVIVFKVVACKNDAKSRWKKWEKLQKLQNYNFQIPNQPLNKTLHPFNRPKVLSFCGSIGVSSVEFSVELGKDLVCKAFSAQLLGATRRF